MNVNSKEIRAIEEKACFNCVNSEIFGTELKCKNNRRPINAKECLMFASESSVLDVFASGGFRDSTFDSEYEILRKLGVK